MSFRTLASRASSVRAAQRQFTRGYAQSPAEIKSQQEGNLAKFAAYGVGAALVGYVGYSYATAPKESPTVASTTGNKPKPTQSEHPHKTADSYGPGATAENHPNPDGASKANSGSGGAKDKLAQGIAQTRAGDKTVGDRSGGAMRG